MFCVRDRESTSDHSSMITAVLARAPLTACTRMALESAKASGGGYKSSSRPFGIDSKGLINPNMKYLKRLKTQLQVQPMPSMPHLHLCQH